VTVERTFYSRLYGLPILRVVKLLFDSGIPVVELS
jgi:hypothetical protein